MGISLTTSEKNMQSWKGSFLDNMTDHTIQKSLFSYDALWLGQKIDITLKYKND